MANWMTAEEIGELYIVGPERLQAFAARGNLACRRPVGGAPLYDEAGVARFFRPRRGGILVAKQPEGEHLGVLGLSKLGDAPRLGGRGAELPATGIRRHRPLPSNMEPVFPGQQRQRDGEVVVPLARKRAAW